MFQLKIPNSQILWVTHKDKNGKVKYITTSDKSRENYYLYRVEKDGKLNKIKKLKQPLFDKLIRL